MRVSAAGAAQSRNSTMALVPLGKSSQPGSNPGLAGGIAVARVLGHESFPECVRRNDRLAYPGSRTGPRSSSWWRQDHCERPAMQRSGVEFNRMDP